MDKMIYTASPTSAATGAIRAVNEYGERTVRYGERTLIMGILNVTPDSFSDGGRYETVARAVKRAQELVRLGADILDIGGESTRPGAVPVHLDEELRRVVPAVKAIREAVDVPISIDTYKAEVARQALEAGAHWINDVWGLDRDPHMREVAAGYGCPVVLTHNRKERELGYTDLIGEVVADLTHLVEKAIHSGIAREHIMLDPGIGFAKTLEDNFVVMNRLSAIVELGFPVVLGTSRKSMIWRTLNQKPEEALEGTAATVTLGIAQGCQILRVHDVRAMRLTADMTDAMLRGR